MEKVCGDTGDRRVLFVLITQIMTRQLKDRNRIFIPIRTSLLRENRKKKGRKKKCCKGQRISIVNELNTKIRKEQNLNSDDF